MNEDVITIKDAKCGKLTFEFSISVFEHTETITFECPYCGLKTIVSRNGQNISVTYENV